MMGGSGPKAQQRIKPMWRDPLGKGILIGLGVANGCWLGAYLLNGWYH